MSGDRSVPDDHREWIIRRSLSPEFGLVGLVRASGPESGLDHGETLTVVPSSWRVRAVAAEGERDRLRTQRDSAAESRNRFYMERDEWAARAERAERERDEAKRLLRRALTYVHPHTTKKAWSSTMEQAARLQAESVVMDVQAFLASGVVSARPVDG